MLPISTCKFTMFDYFKDVIVKTADDLKNSRSPYSENSQLIKIDVNSPSLPSKDAELFYCHVARLLFVRKRTRPNIPACVISLFTRVKSPMGYCKDLHLNIDLLFLNKIQILLMISRNHRFCISRHCFLSITSIYKTNSSKSFNQENLRI